MNAKDVRYILKTAQERDPKAYSDLREVYATTDMPYDEFMAHMRIIAEGES